MTCASLLVWRVTAETGRGRRRRRRRRAAPRGRLVSSQGSSTLATGGGGGGGSCSETHCQRAPGGCMSSVRLLSSLPRRRCLLPRPSPAERAQGRQPGFSITRRWQTSSVTGRPSEIPAPPSEPLCPQAPAGGSAHPSDSCDVRTPEREGRGRACKEGNRAAAASRGSKKSSKRAGCHSEKGSVPISLNHASR